MNISDYNDVAILIRQSDKDRSLHEITKFDEYFNNYVLTGKEDSIPDYLKSILNDMNIRKETKNGSKRTLCHL